MKRFIRVTMAAVFVLGIFFYSQGFLYPQISVKERNIDTNGETRGLALRDFYAFLADGDAGLKIINMSNRFSFRIKGNLSLPGSFVEQVAVDADMVVLTDTKKKQVHFVDAWDTANPELLASLSAQGDTPRAVAVHAAMAFVVEYGEKPGTAGYFSGIEVFSIKEKISSVQLRKLRGVRDIAVRHPFVFVGGANRVLTFEAANTGLSPRPLTVVSFPVGEDVQSIALFEEWLFVFGRMNLYVVHVLDPLKQKILDQSPVPGCPDFRRVDAAILDLGGGKSSGPQIFILLTTLISYGMYTFDMPSGTLNAFPMYDLKTPGWIYFRDVHKTSDGKVEIFDSALSRYFYPGAVSGGTFALGALGGYGMGFVQVDTK